MPRLVAASRQTQQARDLPKSGGSMARKNTKGMAQGDTESTGAQLDKSVIAARKALMGQMFLDGVSGLNQFRQMCEHHAQTRNISTPAAVQELLLDDETLKESLISSLDRLLPALISSEESQAKCKQRWKNLETRSGWLMDKLTLYTVFGEVCASYRFVEALIKLSDLEPDFDNAFEWTKEEQQKRRQGNFHHARKGKTNSQSAWQAGDVQAVVERLLQEGRTYTKVKSQKKTAGRSSTSRAARKQPAPSGEDEVLEENIHVTCGSAIEPRNLQPGSQNEASEKNGAKTGDPGSMSHGPAGQAQAGSELRKKQKHHSLEPRAGGEHTATRTYAAGSEIPASTSSVGLPQRQHGSLDKDDSEQDAPPTPSAASGQDDVSMELTEIHGKITTCRISREAVEDTNNGDEGPDQLPGCDEACEPGESACPEAERGRGGGSLGPVHDMSTDLDLAPAFQDAFDISHDTRDLFLTDETVPSVTSSQLQTAQSTPAPLQKAATMPPTRPLDPSTADEPRPSKRQRIEDEETKKQTHLRTWFEVFQAIAAPPPKHDDDANAAPGPSATYKMFWIRRGKGQEQAQEEAQPIAYEYILAVVPGRPEQRITVYHPDTTNAEQISDIMRGDDALAPRLREDLDGVDLLRLPEHSDKHDTAYACAATVAYLSCGKPVPDGFGASSVWLRAVHCLFTGGVPAFPTFPAIKPTDGPSDSPFEITDAINWDLGTFDAKENALKEIQQHCTELNVLRKMINPVWDQLKAASACSGPSSRSIAELEEDLRVFERYRPALDSSDAAAFEKSINKIRRDMAQQDGSRRLCQLVIMLNSDRTKIGDLIEQREGDLERFKSGLREALDAANRLAAEKLGG